MAQLPEQMHFDMKFSDLMKEVNVTVNFTDWRVTFLRLRIAKFLMWLACKILGTNAKVIE